MKCPTCTAEGCKHGKDKSGQQRYRCGQCRKTYLAPKPMAGSRTPLKQVAFALNLLLEGTSARAIERLTGINYETVIEWMVQAGEQCRDYPHREVRPIRNAAVVPTSGKRQNRPRLHDRV